MAKSSHPQLIPSFRAILVFMITSSVFTTMINSCSTNHSQYCHPVAPPVHIAPPCLRFDPEPIHAASVDFGRIVSCPPAAVFHPSSVNDIVSLIEFCYSLPSPIGISAKGRGHSVRGQAMAEGGVVVEMSALNHDKKNSRIRVYHHNRKSACGGPNLVCSGDTNGLIELGGGEDDAYVDVGGEQLWIDVLLASLEHGLAPVSWTDYLYLSVGGTLSNAGISGQSFRYGPQISNVIELDVVTGKGKLVTCSREMNSDLFFAVLGGLGQFGIIARARIPLHPAPKKVRWVRMLYDDFGKFTSDQESIISKCKYEDKERSIGGLSYLEGSLIMPKDGSNFSNWKSSFFTASDLLKMASLTVPSSGIIYCLEIGIYYDYHHHHRFTSNSTTIDMEFEVAIEGLKFLPGFIFTKDVSLMEFLNRVRKSEVELRSKGLWDIPHPWLNLFVPRSRISDFNDGAFLNIIAKKQKPDTLGPILVYPMNRNKWDERMSAMITEDEDEIFYTVGLLHSSGTKNDYWQDLEEVNQLILMFCEEKGIRFKQYFPHYQYENRSSKSKQEEFWRDHFGSKWKLFKERKAQFDPKMILSPGQRIFN